MNENITVPKPAIPSLRNRVMGCWLGKAVGGTLGIPFEGEDGPFDLDFYDPIPREMMPNDDLDLQVVWSCVLGKLDPVRVDRHILAQAWLDHVRFPWDEYGIAIRNLKLGIKPPLSGSYDNWFARGMGAPIRSEIWACLAPGNPKLAAAYAYEDACVDHDGDGIWGEMFLAALESAAFTESDPDRLLDVALEYLPTESVTKRAVIDTRVWYRELSDWRAVREKILERHGHENFTDAPMNIAFIVLGWLASEGDFGRAICVAVNCGKDTDCTGATVGSLMGIIDPDCIPERWLAPIGRSLVLNTDIVGLDAPSTLDDFTDLVLDVQKRLAGRIPTPEITAQSAEAFRFPVRRRFVDVFPQGDRAPSFESSVEVILPGNFAQLPASDFQKAAMLLEYRFHVDYSGPVHIMVNTPQNCRVWLDGKLLLTRNGGRMAPSLHRAPEDQYSIQTVEKGAHRLAVAIGRPIGKDFAEWVVGVGDPKTYAWYPRAFLE